MDTKKLSRHTNILKREGIAIILMPPAETIEIEKNLTIIYKTRNVTTKEIGIASADQMEKALEEYKITLVFYTRGTRFSSKYYRNATKALAKTYRGKRNSRVRLGKVYRESNQSG